MWKTTQSTKFDWFFIRTPKPAGAGYKEEWWLAQQAKNAAIRAAEQER